MENLGELRNGYLEMQPNQYKVISRYEDVMYGQKVTVTRYESKRPADSLPIIYPVSLMTKYVTIEELLERENND
jgi:hypothetical protein